MFVSTDVGVMSVRRPWVTKKNQLEQRYRNLRSASSKRGFWREYRREYPWKLERYQKAGKWITPEEGERVYGDIGES